MPLVETSLVAEEELGAAYLEEDLEDAELDDEEELDEDHPGDAPVGHDDEEIEPIEVELTTDSLQLFLKDVGKVDLLTAAQ